MPASKKDLKKAQQKANIKEGVGDAKGRIPSRTKVRPQGTTVGSFDNNFISGWERDGNLLYM